MKEQLIEFKTAKLAKEKQFYDKNVYGEVRLSQPNYYDNLGVIHDIREAFDPKDYDLKDCFNAPTQSLLQRWLREVHNIDVYVQPVRFTGYIEIGYYTYSVMGEIPIKNYRYNSWEESLEVGLLEGLKLI
jgi:hypothetical protein